MGVVGLLFGKKQRAVIGKKDATDELTIGVSGIVVDATINENHVTSADVTENPVEDGAKITDHVQLKPAELTIEGVITDSPLTEDFLGVSVPANFHNFAATIKTKLGATSRSIDAYQRLVELQNKREPFTAVTGLKQYKNMILVNLSVPRNAQTGKAIHFTAQMKQIRIVKSKSLGVSNLKSAVKNLASKTKDLGQKVTSAVPAKDPTNAAPSGTTTQSKPSIIFGLFGSIGKKP